MKFALIVHYGVLPRFKFTHMVVGYLKFYYLSVTGDMLKNINIRAISFPLGIILDSQHIGSTMFWFYYNICLFFILVAVSAINFSTRNPAPVFKCSTFTKRIFDLIGALRETFFFIDVGVFLIFEKKRREEN